MRIGKLEVAVLFLLALSSTAYGAEPAVIDPFDTLNLRTSGEKVKLSLVDGKVGHAVQLNFADDCKNSYAIGRSGGKPEWDQAAGISFWLKGDGSDHVGCFEMIWNEDFGVRYAYSFPLGSTEWKKIVVPWRDLLPEVSNPAAKPIDPANGNAPSKLSAPWFGKWWYWRDTAAHSYAVSDMRLEPKLDTEETPKPATDAPLARIHAKLKAGQPVTIVTMGDSLTDYKHWANRETNWPTILKQTLEKKYGSQVTIINPAIGGTELRQNLVLLPEWSSKHADADLVTICFGGNDWNAGMRGPGFERAQREAVELVRRATGNKADVLIMTTCPGVEHWDTMAELAAACREAAKTTNAGLADIYAAFHTAGQTDKERLFASDKVHLGKAGHELFASTIVEAIEKSGQ